MKTNLGETDKTIRLLISILIAAIGLLTGSWWGFLAFAVFLPVAFSWCPVYFLFGIDTNKHETTF